MCPGHCFLIPCALRHIRERRAAAHFRITVQVVQDLCDLRARRIFAGSKAAVAHAGHEAVGQAVLNTRIEPRCVIFDIVVYCSGNKAACRQNVALGGRAARAGVGHAALRRFRCFLRHLTLIPSVAEGGDRLHTLLVVTAGAVLTGGSAGSGAGRSNGCVVLQVVTEGSDRLHTLLVVAASAVLTGGSTGGGAGRGNGCVVLQVMTQRIRIGIHVAVAAGASVGRVALFGAGRRCDNILVAVGMGNIIVMDVGGQKVIIFSGRNRDRFPLRLAPGIVHIGQRCTRSESAIANARHAVRDRHTGQRPALIESTPANARHAVWDRHAGQRSATKESPLTNARHAISNHS